MPSSGHLCFPRQLVLHDLLSRWQRPTVARPCRTRYNRDRSNIDRAGMLHFELDRFHIEMRSSGKSFWVAALCILVNQAAGVVARQGIPHAGSGVLSTGSPESVGMAGDRLSKIAAPIQETIERGEIPGAVVLVARKGRIVYHRPFGYRAL